jgi:hypothetical protein
MVAALLRVVHSGIQDSNLLPRKGNPNPHFFVKAMIRAGRFTTQWVRLDFNTRPSLGTTAVITLPRKGHLLSRLYLVTTLPDIATTQQRARARAAEASQTFLGPTFGWTNSVGHALLQQATIEIGGTRVEQIDGRLLEVLDEFYSPLEKVPLTDKLLPRSSTGFTPGLYGRDNVQRAVTPLPFWFSSGDPGAFLPVDAIQADEIRLSVTFAGVNSLYTSTAQLDTSAFTGPPVAGAGYYPLANSTFYVADPAGTPQPGLNGNPKQTVLASVIPNVAMPSAQALTQLGDTYIMAEYVYLDKPEANRFRLADIQVPVLQHYAFDPVDTGGSAVANCYLKIPNPTRNLFFYLNRREATFYNAPFLATRDLSDSAAPIAPWWPNASRISDRTYTELVPGFQFRNTEPLEALALIYEGKLYRYQTTAPSFFRSLIPAYEMRKSPWVNRYYYNLPFSLSPGHLAPSDHCGEANLDKIVNINLQLAMRPLAGYADPNAVPRYFVNIWAETYNILRVYGGRAGMMFSY